MTVSGWGEGSWGEVPWGLGVPGSPVPPPSTYLIAAIAVRENVVRLYFTAELEFTGLFGPNDAGDPTHYIITPVAGTFGRDGLPCRSVSPIVAADVDDEGHPGTVIDVTVDRPFSPYPAAYTVSVNNLVSVDSGVLNPSNSTATYFGSKQPPADLAPDGATPSRDIAHPDTLFAELDPLPDAGDESVLGSIPVDSTGDYAFDEGLTSLAKRVFRRFVTATSAFLHASGYGVGVGGHLKKLATPAVRQAIAAAAESQIALEPDVAAVSVRATFDPLAPSLGRFVVLVRPKVGQPRRFDVPFEIVAK